MAEGGGGGRGSGIHPRPAVGGGGGWSGRRGAGACAFGGGAGAFGGGAGALGCTGTAGISSACTRTELLLEAVETVRVGAEPVAGTAVRT